MDLTVNDDRKLVTVWLTNAEKTDPKVSESLNPLYKKYSDMKYTVCVFRSGKEDLADTTSALLRYNRKKLAQLEVQRDREMGMTM